MSAHKYFGKDFYPTPQHVIERMGIDCAGKICLEPSAGKGDIVDYLTLYGAKEVHMCEIEPAFKPLLQTKGNFLADDFLTVTSEQVSRIQCIIMNPPFSAANKHLLHAWEIAPDGCEITCLINWDSVKYERNRELKNIIDTYGAEENIGPVFAQAERMTEVNIGLVKLFKPVDNNSTNFEGFYLCDDEPIQQSGIMPYNEIRAIVNSYIGTAKLFDKLTDLNNEFAYCSSMLGMRGRFSYEVEYNKQTVSKAEFLLKLQKTAWEKIIELTGATKYVTTSVRDDMSKFMGMQVKYPFTVRNVYRMLEIIFGTRENTINKSIVKVVDEFTRYTHENRYGVAGWKTNEGHLLNKKFIVDYITESSFADSSKVRVQGYRDRFEKIIDLVKCLCFLTGTSYDTLDGINSCGELYAVNDTRRKEGDPEYVRGSEFYTNVWYDYAFFEVKYFKKGTGHFKFKDLKVWELLNRKYAALKGEVLPEKF